MDKNSVKEKSFDALEINVDKKLHERVDELIKQRETINAFINENVALLCVMYDINLEENNVNYQNGKLIVIKKK